MTTRVLILADHPMIRLGIRAALGAAAEVDVIGEASDARDLAAWAQKLGPDLVLIDLSTPSGEGFEAVRRLRQSCPEVQVLALGATDQSAAQRAAEAGASRVLPKDVSPVDLANAVHAVRVDDLGASPPTDPAPAGRRPDEPRARWGLTAREWEVLVEIARGPSAKEIAGKLYLSTSTVKSHVRAIYRQLGLRNRAQAVLFLMERYPRLVHNSLPSPDPDDGM